MIRLELVPLYIRVFIFLDRQWMHQSSGETFKSAPFVCLSAARSEYIDAFTRRSPNWFQRAFWKRKHFFFGYVNERLLQNYTCAEFRIEHTSF